MVRDSRNEAGVMDDRVAELAAALERDDDIGARRVLASVPDDRDVHDRLHRSLASAAGAGSQLAIELLVEFIDGSGLTRAAVSRFLIDEDAVDEVAQDVLLAVAASVPSYDGRARFSTWVHGIARHRATDHLRRRRDATDELAPTPTLRISSMIASREAVHQQLARLPDDYERAVTLRDVDQLPYEEVAQRLGISSSTARTRVARGRALVARMLGDQGLA